MIYELVESININYLIGFCIGMPIGLAIAILFIVVCGKDGNDA